MRKGYGLASNGSRFHTRYGLGLPLTTFSPTRSLRRSNLPLAAKYLRVAKKIIVSDCVAGNRSPGDYSLPINSECCTIEGATKRPSAARSAGDIGGGARKTLAFFGAGEWDIPPVNSCVSLYFSASIFYGLPHSVGDPHNSCRVCIGHLRLALAVVHLRRCVYCFSLRFECAARVGENVVRGRPRP